MEAERRGRIKQGDTLIEATSGNTGIALAQAAAMRGFKMKLIMPANMSEERKSAMAAFGAELISIPSGADGGGMEAARDLAHEMEVWPGSVELRSSCFGSSKDCENGKCGSKYGQLTLCPWLWAAQALLTCSRYFCWLPDALCRPDSLLVMLIQSASL